MGFAASLDAYKELETQRARYIEGLIPLVREGKIYANFKIPGTETGRLSGDKPNLQNITRGKEGIPNIRTLFLPEPNRVMLQADYSQAELRTIARLSGDSGLSRIYQEGISLHKMRAARFYGDQYTGEEYVKSKNMNFGVTYGQSAQAFANMYHLSVGEAQAYIDDWFDQFPDIRLWIRDVDARIARDGYLQSPFGHKRRFHIRTRDNKDEILRQGVNFLPQNIAANLTLCAFCDISDWIDSEDFPATLRITVHDSIVGDVDPSCVDEFAELVKICMENAPVKYLEWDFPFEVDLSTGPTWGDLVELRP